MTGTTGPIHRQLGFLDPRHDIALVANKLEFNGGLCLQVHCGFLHNFIDCSLLFGA